MDSNPPPHPGPFVTEKGMVLRGLKLTRNIYGQMFSLIYIKKLKF